MIGRERPILLKKSALISMAEKYVSEIEILNLAEVFGLRFNVAAC
jgi:hypothetical protein